MAENLGDLGYLGLVVKVEMDSLTAALKAATDAIKEASTSMLASLNSVSEGTKKQSSTIKDATKDMSEGIKSSFEKIRSYYNLTSEQMSTLTKSFDEITGRTHLFKAAAKESGESLGDLNKSFNSVNKAVLEDSARLEEFTELLIKCFKIGKEEASIWAADAVEKYKEVANARKLVEMAGMPMSNIMQARPAAEILPVANLAESAALIEKTLTEEANFSALTADTMRANMLAPIESINSGFKQSSDYFRTYWLDSTAQASAAMKAFYLEEEKIVANENVFHAVKIKNLKERMAYTEKYITEESALAKLTSVMDAAMNPSQSFNLGTSGFGAWERSQPARAALLLKERQAEGVALLKLEQQQQKESDAGFRASAKNKETIAKAEADEGNRILREAYEDKKAQAKIASNEAIKIAEEEADAKFAIYKKSRNDASALMKANLSSIPAKQDQNMLASKFMGGDEIAVNEKIILSYEEKAQAIIAANLAGGKSEAELTAMIREQSEAAALNAKMMTETGFSTAQIARMTAVKGEIKSVNTELKGVKTTSEGIGKSFGAWMISSMIIGKLNEASGAFQKFGEDVLKVSQSTGMAFKESSQLVYIAQRTHVGVELLDRSMLLMTRAAQAHTSAFRAFNVTVKDSNGTYLSAIDILKNVADKYKELGGGASGAAMAHNVLGRSGQLLVPILMQGRDAIQKMQDQTKLLGLEMSKLETQRFQKLKKATTDMSMAFEGLGVQVAEAAAPMQTALANGLTNLIIAFDKLDPKLKESIEILTILAGSVLFVVTSYRMFSMITDTDVLASLAKLIPRLILMGEVIVADALAMTARMIPAILGLVAKLNVDLALALANTLNELKLLGAGFALTGGSIVVAIAAGAAFGGALIAISNNAFHLGEILSDLGSVIANVFNPPGRKSALQVLRKDSTDALDEIGKAAEKTYKSVTKTFADMFKAPNLAGDIKTGEDKYGQYVDTSAKKPPKKNANMFHDDYQRTQAAFDAKVSLLETGTKEKAGIILTNQEKLALYNEYFATFLSKHKDYWKKHEKEEQSYHNRRKALSEAAIKEQSELAIKEQSELATLKYEEEVISGKKTQSEIYADQVIADKLILEEIKKHYSAKSVEYERQNKKVIESTKKASDYELEQIHKIAQAKAELLSDEASGKANTTKENVSNDLAFGKITPQQAIQADIDAEKLKGVEIRAAHAVALAGLNELDKNYAADLAKLERDTLNKTRANDLEILKLSHKLYQEQYKELMAFGSAIKSSFAPAISGMLQGTLTLQSGMKQIFGSIGKAFADMVANMVTKWVSSMFTMNTATVIWKMITKLAHGDFQLSALKSSLSNIHLIGTHTAAAVAASGQAKATGKVAAVEASVATAATALAAATTTTAASLTTVATAAPIAATGLGSMGAAMGLLTPLATAFVPTGVAIAASSTAIAAPTVTAALAMGHLAVAMAAASVAWIPVIGAALAPIAALATGAAIAMGGTLASFAVGAESLPNDMIANVHKGERILTNSENSKFTNFINNQTNSNSNQPPVVHNHNYSFIDKRGVQEFFREHRDDLQRASASNARLGNK